MSRIAARFASLKARKRTALVPCLTAGILADFIAELRSAMDATTP